jgi:hypothetical protein
MTSAIYEFFDTQVPLLLTEQWKDGEDKYENEDREKGEMEGEDRKDGEVKKEEKEGNEKDVRGEVEAGGQKDKGTEEKVEGGGEGEGEVPVTLQELPEFLSFQKNLNFPWIWVGSHFLPTRKSFVKIPVDAFPFISEIPNKLERKFGGFFSDIGVRESPEISDYVDVLAEIISEHEVPDLTDTKKERHVQVVSQILNFISKYHNVLEFQDKLFVPLSGILSILPPFPPAVPFLPFYSPSLSPPSLFFAFLLSLLLTSSPRW